MSEKFGQLGSWKKNDRNVDLEGIVMALDAVGEENMTLWTKETDDYTLAIVVVDLEKENELNLDINYRFVGKKGWLVDAEYYDHQDMVVLLWHHEKRFPDRQSAEAYADRVKKFTDSHTADELRNKKRTGDLGLSRLEQKVPKMAEVFTHV